MAILKMALSLGLNLQTNTLVTEVVSGPHPEQWAVLTTSGKINATNVFHATNAYSSNLLPEMTGMIVPLKGHAAAIPPTSPYQDQPLGTTMAFVWDDDYDYLIQRQGNGRHVIIGGRDSGDPGGFVGQLGDFDDSTYNDAIVRALKGFPAEHFAGWSAAGDKVQEAHCWTGVMGYSKDMLPFVGELPGKKRQYIAAGYSGHGMARIFLSVKALCQYMWGEEIDQRVPEVYFDLESRLGDEIDLVKLGLGKEE